ncbi:hypothetical protein Aargi30884_27890 [Amedibacterium intestinale]|uniref:Phage capsid-like C-terminal domain-containing protein n=1 Tax=Amedibacterium intestinale TaxID=2583452 RepID=A0A6N4TKW5_9FIRM|nr:phage major capsid protein [Amedibacterium intestinale]BBK23886.1 hypothetical protein Aargi30884_27890 [Amedibacterium intestinale]
MNKEWFKKFIERKKEELKTLQERSDASESIEEVRYIGKQIDAVNEEIRDAQAQLTALEEAEEQRGAGSPLNGNGFNPMQMVGGAPMNQQRGNEEPTATIEYRQAFKKYVQTGEMIPSELRAAATSTTADIGMIIPKTIMDEFIKEVSKVYGHIYAKVRKLNVKGGVEFPISKLTANFKWITESTVSEKQKAGDIKEKVSFSYHIGEIRVAETLLAQVVSLDVFESEITRIMVEAYVKAMDVAIISGTGSGQPLGITVDPRVTNVIEFTEEEFGDWTAWRKKLFAVIPLSKRGLGEFLFPSSTVESYLMTMKDANNRPLFKEATDLNMGNTAGSFFGRTTDLVEPDIIKDFATASNGDVVGVMWVPSDYAINTQLEFGMKRYFDDDTNEWINKGLTIVDGKILDTSGCYLLKKKST